MWGEDLNSLGNKELCNIIPIEYEVSIDMIN